MPAQPILQQQHRDQIDCVTFLLAILLAADVFRGWARDQPAQTREVKDRLPGLRRTLGAKCLVCDVVDKVLQHCKQTFPGADLPGDV